MDFYIKFHDNPALLYQQCNIKNANCAEKLTVTHHDKRTCSQISEIPHTLQCCPHEHKMMLSLLVCLYTVFVPAAEQEELLWCSLTPPKQTVLHHWDGEKTLEGCSLNLFNLKSLKICYSQEETSFWLSGKSQVFPFLCRLFHNKGLM